VRQLFTNTVVAESLLERLINNSHRAFMNGPWVSPRTAETSPEQHGIPHAVSCRALGVSQAWFHKWHQHANAGTSRPGSSGGESWPLKSPGCSLPIRAGAARR
jgi:hypothetical protein